MYTLLKPTLSNLYALTLLVGLFVTSSQVFASADNIRFEPIDIDEGLSQQSVNVIFQDSKGFMWFGTQEGLNRYDGITFASYRPKFDDENSLSGPWVHSISEDQDGNLWISTNNGVNRLDRTNDTFTRYFSDSGEVRINGKVSKAVLTDRDGVVWVGTNKGINRYDAKQDQFKPYNFMSSNGKHVDIFSMVEDITGALWMGSRQHGLLRFDPTTEQLSFIDAQFNDTKSELRENIRSLFIDDEQVLWIGTFKLGLYKLDLKQPKVANQSPTLDKVSDIDKVLIQSIARDNQGTLWVGTFEGLYYNKKETDKYIKLEKNAGNDLDLLGSQISSLYSDRSGVFWVGSFGGLSKWNTRTTQFDHYYADSTSSIGLSGNNITTISSNNPDQIYISSYDGVDVVSPNTGEVRVLPKKTDTSPGLSGSIVMSIMSVSDEEMWFGYRADGISRYNPKTGAFKHYPHDPNDPTTIGESGVTSMLKAKDGTLWFGTYRGGLSKYLPQTDSFYTYKHDPADVATLSSDTIMSLFEGKDGNIWVGTWDAGINLFVPKTGTAFRMKRDENNPTSLAGNTILTIFQDSRNNLWVGTHGGSLNRLEYTNLNQGIIQFDKLFSAEQLRSDVIYGITEDSDGYLWVSTNKGLSKVDTETLEVTVYNRSQGTQANEFNSGSYHRDDAGYMYFGGINGVTRFNPKDIKPNPVMPKVEFTDFQRLNQFDSVASVKNTFGQIEVLHTDYLVGIEFAALDFASPKDNRYKYKLEGFDSDWIEVRDAKRATYTNLPSGEYLFTVIASNSDGIWNNEGTSITLIVHPAPWLSWWAYMIYAAIGMITLWYIYRHFQRKEKMREQYKVHLEKEVSARTSELSEANELLLHASITDQLTGLHNRRYLSDVILEKLDNIMHEFSTAILDDTMTATSGPRLMALMFDLDGFKPINDNYGHEAGDKVIVQVANILKEQCRDDDIVIRWGGDEYMVVAKVDDLEHAKAFSERIRLAIANHGFDVGLSNRFHLSSSLGFALFPFSHYAPHSISWDQVHLLADQALYMSKDAGRNTWSGVVQSDKELPFSVLNSLVPNLEQAINNSDVKVEQRSKAG